MANVISNSVMNGELPLDLNGVLALMTSEDIQASRAMIEGLNALGVPNENGFLPIEFRHLRKMCWPNALQLLMPLRDRLEDQDIFLAFLQKMSASTLSRLGDDIFNDRFYAMMASLG